MNANGQNGTSLIIRQRPDGSQVRIPSHVPNDAPTPTFDPFDPDLRTTDVFSPNFWNIEITEKVRQENGGVPPAYSFDFVEVDFVYNPEEGVQSGEWKLVLSFVETPIRLVLNQTRTRILEQLSGTTKIVDMNRTLRGTPLAVVVKVMNGHQQVIVEVATPVDVKGVENIPNHSPEDVNKELFG